MSNLENTDKVKKKDMPIPNSMKVAYLHDLEKVNINEVTVPEVTGKEVLVKVMAVGICGSDIHYYAHGRIGQRVVKYPHIQGHECAGVVVAVGDSVSRFAVGDRVAIEPGVPCHACQWCREGRYNLCPTVQFLSTPPVKGAFVQYLAHNEDFLFPIPDTLSYENATLAEPLSVGLHAVSYGGLKPYSTVVISGMGPVGLMTILAAKAYGAKDIIVSDMEPFRLETAKKLGATRTINIRDEDVNTVVEEITSGLGVDMVLETSGSVGALQSSISLVKRGGTIVVIGFPVKDEVPLDIISMLQKEVRFCPVYRYRNNYPTAINLLGAEGERAGRIITDRFSLDEIQVAMERAYRNQSDSLKVMIYPNGACQ